ncbi:MAG: DUF3098 domain-containing protein [Bacteroidota bacterium]
MSQRKKKKVVVTDTTKNKNTARTRTAASKTAARAPRKATKEKAPLIFGKENYAWMSLGAGLIVLGMFLMSGGDMPSADVWEDDIIYSTRRTVLAPIVILAGLGVEIYAIFK